MNLYKFIDLLIDEIFAQIGESTKALSFQNGESFSMNVKLNEATIKL